MRGTMDVTCHLERRRHTLIDGVSGREGLIIKILKTRIILERAKLYLRYPLEKLKWFDEA